MRPVHPAGEWALDPGLTFLNHGSFGACPRVVLEEQSRLRDHMEANPVRFFSRELSGLLTAARVQVADFVHADPEGCAFVENATTGVNTLLWNAPLGPGDEILITDHGYEACNLAAEHVAAARGATVRVARIPVPAEDARQISAAILDLVTPRTRVAVIDHITSPTSLIFPAAQIVADLSGAGVRVIVDGAHAPGQIDLDVAAIGAFGYAANWHKWTCAPKGSGLLAVGAEWREEVRPLVISHGAGHRGVDGARFRATFDWTGTSDPTPHLCVPTAIEAVGGMLDGGWAAIRRRNHGLVLRMRDRLVEEFDLVPTGSSPLTGAMVSFIVPERWRLSADPADAASALQRRLDEEHGVVVGVATLRGRPDVLFRLSAHLHCGDESMERLVAALHSL